MSVLLYMGNSTRQKEERMESLYKLIEQCDACPLVSGRPKFVFGEGSVNAFAMFIGEAPGEQEAKTGRPFVGRSGKLLRKMIAAIDITNDNFIANIAKCRPPNNRDPEKQEIETCVKFLKKQIDIICPKLIILLGKTAVKGLFTKYAKFNMRQLRQLSRGTDLYYNGIPVVVTYHPAALLYSKKWVKEAKEDFEHIKNIYKDFKNV